MISVAIDGPSAAGKSTIARMVAKSLGFIYVDTGAMYRAIGLYAIDNNINTKDEKSVNEILKKINIDISFENGNQKILLNDTDVSEKVRANAVSIAASNVSAMTFVREFLFNKQKNLAKQNNVIMDGRDIATVVLPNADVKIFLTASIETRAQRRFDELKLKNCNINYKKIYNEIKKRDYQDSHRKIAPLTKAEDAIFVDTSNMNLSEAVDYITNLIKTSLKKGGKHL